MDNKVLRAALSLPLVISLIASSTLFGAASSSDLGFTKKDCLIIGGTSALFLAAGYILTRTGTEEQAALMQAAPLLRVQLDPDEVLQDYIGNPPYTVAVASSSSASSSSAATSSSASSSSSDESMIEYIDPLNMRGELTYKIFKKICLACKGMSQKQLNHELFHVLVFAGGNVLPCNVHTIFQWTGKKDWRSARRAIAGLVHAGANVNFMILRGALRGVSALRVAIVKSDFYLVKFLLEYGADPNAVTSNGSYLHNCKDANIAKLLCMFGANPNAQFRGESVLLSDLSTTSFKLTPDAEKIRLLIDCGADINFQRDTETILIKALHSRHSFKEMQKIIALLLRLKADHRVKSSNQTTAADRLHEMGRSVYYFDMPLAIGLAKLAKLLNAYRNVETSLLEHLIIDVILDVYSFEDGVRERGQGNVQLLRAIHSDCSAAVDRFYTELEVI